MALADQDESVRIAVRALGDMRNSTHNSSSPHTCEYFIWIWERNPNALSLISTYA